MPKEIIYDSERFYDVEIRWSREASHVSLATVVPPARDSDAPASLGALVDMWDPGTRYTATGIWASLDRDGLNRLIRALRRARDQALGADA